MGDNKTKLPCPSCSTMIVIDRLELVKGNTVNCPKCKANFKLRQEEANNALKAVLEKLEALKNAM